MLILACSSDTQVYLLEDAMDLWASIIVQAPDSSPQALELVPNLFPIYELGSEQLRKSLEITESYLLLAPEHMLSNEMRQPFFTALSSLFGGLKNRAEPNGMVCNIVEFAIRQAHRLGGEAAVEQTASDLVQVGFMPQLLEGLRGSWIAHCSSGPKAKHSPVDGIVETDYFAILARLCLGSLDAFSKVIDVAGPAGTNGTKSLDETMRWLLEEWLSHLDNIGDPGRRKLMVLALTKLLETNRSDVLLSLQSLMTAWTDVITGLREDEEDVGTGAVDSLVLGSQPQPDPHEAPEEGRRRTMTYCDEVHTVSLPSYVKQKLEGSVAAAGGLDGFQERWLVNVDKDVLQSFMRLGIM